MANRIKLKRSNTGGSAPTTANIEVGEVAMNMADRLLYFRDPSNNILSFTIEDLNNFTTDDLTEGVTNLYYTDTRVNANFSTKTTDALTEGVTNLYYTDGRFDARLSTKSTSDLTEGSNLYYTDGRVDTHLNTSTALTGEFLSWNGTDYDWVAGGGGGIANVVDDTTPQLGGNLDLNNFDINGTGNIDITGSISSQGLTNTATSFGTSVIASRNGFGGALNVSRSGQGALADGQTTGNLQLQIEHSTGNVYPGGMYGRWDSTNGNEVIIYAYDDGQSTYIAKEAIVAAADEMRLFDNDLTISTNGTHQTIASNTGNITLTPGTTSNQIYLSNGASVIADGSVADPYMRIVNTQNTPGNYNAIGSYEIWGKNSSNGYINTSVIDSYFTSDTAGSESSELAFRILDGGGQSTPFAVNEGAVIVRQDAENFYRIQNNGTAADFKLNNTNGSIANNDQLGVISFQQSFSSRARIGAIITDITGGSEDVTLYFNTHINGVDTEQMRMESNKVVASNNLDVQNSWLQIQNNGTPIQYLYNNSNHGNGASVGQVEYWGTDNFGGAKQYSTIRSVADDNSSSGVSGSIELQVSNAGTMDTVAVVDKSGIELIGYRETANPPGSSGTLAPNPSGGTYGVITLSGNITFNGFTNGIAGQSYTLVIKQPGSGGPYTLSSTMLFSGGGKTLSTAPNAVDVMTVFYDGTSYYASLTTGYA